MNKNILKYIIPSMIASLFIGAYAIIDGAFIGSKLGDIGLSAINIAWPITAFTQTIGLAIGIGGGIRLSIALGENDNDKYNKVFNNTILYLSLSSVILTIIVPLLSKRLLILSGATGDTLLYGMRYLFVMGLGSVFQIFSGGLVPLLKNKGEAKYSMFVSIAACLCNVLFDYLLIYVIPLDLLGAAIASILGQGIIATASFIKLKPKLSLKVSFDKEILLSSISPFILNYSYAIITILNNTICLKYGGDAGVAAYTIFSYLIYIVQSSASGTGDGVQPIISYYYGQNDYKKMKHTFNKSSIIGFIFSSVIISIVIMLKNIIPNIYNLGPESLNYYNNSFYFFIGAYFMLVINRLIGCFMYSANSIKISNFLTLIEPLVITPILLITLGYLRGIYGALESYLYIQFIQLIISILLLILVIRRYNKNEHCRASISA